MNVTNASVPDFHISNFDEARRLFNQGRVSQALGAFIRASEQYPEWPQAQHNVASCLRILGRKQEAITAYRKVLVMNPRFIASMNDLAIVLKEVGQVNEALELRKEVTIYTTKGREYAFYNHAALLAEAGRTDEAIENYRAVLLENFGCGSRTYQCALYACPQFVETEEGG